MAGVKQTPVRLPGSNPKTKNSGSSSAGKASSTGSAKKAKDATAAQPHKKPRKAAAPVQPPAPKPSTLKKPPQLVPETAGPAKSSNETSANGESTEQASSDEESNEERSGTDETEDSEEEEEQDETSKNSASISESESGSGSEEDSSDKEDETLPPAPAVPSASTAQRQANVADFRAPPPFNPPTGFEIIEKWTPSTKTAQATGFSDLSNKQIWHITAPPGVPISSIKELALDKLTSGEPILRHGGSDFTMVDAELRIDSTKVMLPSANGYKPVTKVIAKTLHLQQTSGSHSSSGTSIAPPRPKAIKPVRPQPEGLRMRFRPIGFGQGDPGMLGSSDGEMDTVMEDISYAQESSKTVPKRKKQGTDVDGDGSAKKRSKDKKKKLKEDTEPAESLNPKTSSKTKSSSVSATPDGTKKKKKKEKS